ncbi:efflux RND transporter permease subunit [Escherichia coli]
MIVKRPVSASLARAFFYIVLLSILSTGIALLTLASSLRDAEAINIAGSLRMQSYRLGYDLQSGSPQLNAHRQLFQQALHSPVLTNLNVWYVPEAVKTRYAHLNANWLEMNNRLSKGDLPWYQANINNYVNQIDLFVLALQHYAERKMLLVVAISLAGGIGIFTLVFFTLRRIRHQVVAPLNQLVTASQRIEHGQFDSPPLDTSLPNELGLLAKTFNQMSSELHKLYLSLEASVEEKTRDLHEAKRRLEVLYQCSQALNTSQIDVHCFRHILQIVRDNEAAEYLELNVGENWRISEGQPNPELPMQILPVTMQETVYGELHWQNSHVSSSEPLLNSVSSMLGRGLYFNQAQKHFQQLLLMGTFSVLYAFGYSVNTLTMFAMVLAIGLLVDDAIVVVENVERIMSEEGLTPREATRKSMGQIQGALVGIAMVLSAVFVPMAFFGGTTGAIYRQFSITIVAAMVLSVLVAMILTPALCATLLKPLKKGEHHGQKGFFAWFNQMFNRNAERYEKGVAKILHRSLRWIVIYVLLLGGMVFLFLRLPTSFLPLEDRGMFTTSVQLPSGSTQQQTLKVVEQIEKYYFTHEKDNIMSVFATVGSGPGGNGQNVARMFIRLKDWSERDSKTGTSFAIIERATKAFNKIKEARVIASSPPAISGLGSSAGFDMELQDHAGAGHDALMAARNQLLALAAENPELTRVRHNGLDDSPQLQIDIDQRKAQALGVDIDDINDTLQTAWGSSYVNDFMDRGRVKKVYVQAAAPYRMLPDDINLWYVRNKDGGMVPFSAFATSRWETGSPRLERYNGYSAVEIVGEAAPGVSTGTAMDIMESLVKQLPNGFGLEWTAMSYQERLSGAQAPALYAISLLVVFLCLAALYESWSVPFSVMLVVPLGVIGALLATWMRGLENDVYFQVGLLTVIGLSAKNAILIVEFANEMNQKGHDLFEATLHACRQRLRPILMTSLAFIFGVLPMATSTGAGSGGQHAVGTGVMGGMISATILAIYFVPLFFVLVRRRFPLKPRPE